MSEGAPMDTPPVPLETNSETDQLIEAANTLVLLHACPPVSGQTSLPISPPLVTKTAQLTPDLLQVPGRRKRRKSGTPRKRAQYVSPPASPLQSEELLTGASNLAMEDPLEIDVCAITEPSLIKISKDPTPITGSRIFNKRKTKQPMKLYYESLIRRELLKHPVPPSSRMKVVHTPRPAAKPIPQRETQKTDQARQPMKLYYISLIEKEKPTKKPSISRSAVVKAVRTPKPGTTPYPLTQLYQRKGQTFYKDPPKVSDSTAAKIQRLLQAQKRKNVREAVAKVLATDNPEENFLTETSSSDCESTSQDTQHTDNVQCSDVSSSESSLLKGNKYCPKPTFTSMTETYIPPTKKSALVAEKVNKLLQARRAKAEARTAKRLTYNKREIVKPKIPGKKLARATPKNTKATSKAVKRSTPAMDLTVATALTVSQALLKLQDAQSTPSSVADGSTQSVLTVSQALLKLQSTQSSSTTPSSVAGGSTQSAQTAKDGLSSAKVVPLSYKSSAEPSKVISPPKSKKTTKTVTTPKSSKFAGEVPITLVANKAAAVSSPPTQSDKNPSLGSITPSTDIKSLLSSLEGLPKGLNLPVLDFLRVNFPTLRLDNLDDILQVNTLLAQTLQMQQQVLQAQETAVSITGTSGLASKVAQSIAELTKKAENIKTTHRQKKKSISEISPGAAMKMTTKTAQTGVDGAVRKGKTPVLVQIIRSQPSVSGSPTKPSPVVVPSQPKSSLLTSPLVLAGPKTALNISSTSSPLQTAADIQKSKEADAKKTTSRAKLQAVQLAKSLVEQADSEDIDVGEPFQQLELPIHLKDHSYSLYNPMEGERIKPKAGTFKVSTNIPPARVSYAPMLPDSPTMLYKLLKVNPRRSSSKSSGAKNGTKTPSIKRQGRFNPSGGSRARRSGVRGVKGVGGEGSGRGSKSSSRAQSEDGSNSSASEHSDVEGTDQMVIRRRSQRFVGQRKRYVDDVNLSLSDEEIQEIIMEPKLTAKKDYHGYEQDDDEYNNDGSLVVKEKLVKNKTKAVSVNPTEGFQYSDIYFEPPAEEAEVVERILAHRTRGTTTEAEKDKYGETMEEFFVKYKSYSYLHAKWDTYDNILKGDKRFDGKVKRYHAKQASLGIFADIDDELFNPEYTVVDRVLDKATQEEVNGETVTHFLVKWRSLAYEDSTWELMEDVDSESIRLFDKRTTIPDPSQQRFVSRPPPSKFKPIKDKDYLDGNQLRSYQLEGVNWLLFNWYTRQNCILADEMGLGKTIQSIALLQEIYNAGITGPFLVIAPLSTIANWQRESELWTDFNVVVYHGSAYSRRLIHEYELYHRDSTGKVIPNAYKFDLIITTYEVILSDDSELQFVQWRVVIIDEAHRLKNRNCKLLEELKAIDMEHRVLLTGTPLQNNVEELFSLLNFLEPSTFASHLAFLQQFGELKTEEQVEELKSILKPMMLRRLKEDVEKTLAPKEETIVEVELTVIQKQYYRAILERNFTFLAKPGGGGAVPSLLNVMMELRKCCNHPFLIKGAEQHILEDFQRRHPSTPSYECLVQASGKLVLISKLLPKLKANGHKVLIFSQMVRCLDMLEDFLRMRGYLYERIDGNVRGTLRQAAIDRFSKPNSDRFVFLLCTRAGGLGINLTAADTVIIYDSDWNPQNDLQAQARCHRIGQNKAVKVYRLITRNTYERDMFDRASLKLGLDKAVLQSFSSQQATTTTSSGPPQLSKKEVEDLLKKGAYGALMDEDDDANKFCEEDIDQILERRTQVRKLESEGKGSTFAKASFSADGSTDISIDDPEFWQKWAERAKLDLEDLANKDTLVIDTPRQRRQVRRYGNDNQEEVVDMSEMIDEVVDILPSRGKRAWTKLECLRVEKGLLTYGWSTWKRVHKHCNFRKRNLGLRDVENIARTILVYCLAHFSGDEKVTPYVNRLVNPGTQTEVLREGEIDESGFYHEFTEKDYADLRAKDPETLFEDVSYMKHLKRHSNKILLRVRQLHVLRWSMLVDYYDQIMAGTLIKDLYIDLPKPEESPPASWWNVDCDTSLLVGIVKHGYEMFGPMRSDKFLCFKDLCGEEPRASSKKKKAALVRAVALAAKTKSKVVVDEWDSDVSVSGESEEEEGWSGTATPQGNKSSSGKTSGSLHTWPILADVNTRARRYVSTWIRQQRRDEIKQQHLQRDHVKKEKEAEYTRKKELRKAELAQKWSKREEQDFARVVAHYGVVFNAKTNKYDWSHFRFLASLTKKSDERLTLYLHDFKQMCWRVLKKKKKKSKRGLSGIAVEAINEERASRCLQRINLLSAIREEILPHPEFNTLIKYCELSFEVPSWWIPVVHDTDLLKGVANHGILHSDDLIYNDLSLRFKTTVPESALFDPNTNQVVGGDDSDSSSEEEEDEESHTHKKDRKPSHPVPLGWPKEKAIIIRMTRIVYAFRNRTWPRPMEGLDLFTPTVAIHPTSSESESDQTSEDEGDEDWGGYEGKGEASREDGEEDVDVDGDRDFEVEKRQGLKLTIKKTPQIPRSSRSTTRQSTAAEDTKLTIRIPLVKLTFASSAGLKRIPKKRPLDQDSCHDDAPEGKKQKTGTSQTKGIVIVDPTTVKLSELNGLERVGVINRNTRERLPLKQSPTLKKLSLWLDGHPHFNVESDWGDIVIEWGALKPDMYHRVLREGQETHEEADC